MMDNNMMNDGMMNKGKMNNGMMNKDSMNNDCPPLGVVFDGDGEREVYGDYGFSRGDVAYLFSSNYNISTEETMNGKIQKVFRVRLPDNDCYTLAIISTDSGPVLVELGPVWYLDEQKVMVQEGDMVSVKGSRLRSNGRFMMLASQMKLNNKMVRLKNMNGKNDTNSPTQMRGSSMQQSGMMNGNNNGDNNSWFDNSSQNNGNSSWFNGQPGKK
ncbi:MAG: hypothetical protein WAM28_01285 [Chlamydiales bacterium]